MSGEESCETHVWASVGVATRDGTVCRIWECERCHVWTAEPFDPDRERDWDDTWLSEG
jgi:hypothetical protein